MSNLGQLKPVELSRLWAPSDGESRGKFGATIWTEGTRISKKTNRIGSKEENHTQLKGSD